MSSERGSFPSMSVCYGPTNNKSTLHHHCSTRIITENWFFFFGGKILHVFPSQTRLCCCWIVNRKLNDVISKNSCKHLEQEEKISEIKNHVHDIFSPLGENKHNKLKIELLHNFFSASIEGKSSWQRVHDDKMLQQLVSLVIIVKIRASKLLVILF